MAVNYSGATKNARMTAVRDQIDGGVSTGKLNIYDSSDVILGTVLLSDPCGTVAANTLTFTGFPRSDVSADNAGIGAKATITDSADVVVISGLTVGLAGSGADIILDNTNIAAGQSIVINSASITHAP